MDFSVESLLKAVDNENNESILNLSSKQIKQEKNDILQKLGVKGQTLVDLHKRLKDYRFIDGLENLNFGAFVRWINISDPTDVYITNGGYVCEMTATDDTVCNAAKMSIINSSSLISTRVWCSRRCPIKRKSFSMLWIILHPNDLLRFRVSNHFLLRLLIANGVYVCGAANRLYGAV